MPEGANVEIAHKLTEQEHDQHNGTHARGWHRFVEFGEVAILAIVAVATAWSGFQATEWDGEQSRLYGEASTHRFEAEAASTRRARSSPPTRRCSPHGCRRTRRATPRSRPR